MVRFYLRSSQPELELYASPVNIDPLEPAVPVSHPADFATELAEATGRFYTQGMPEETKALEVGILSREEFFDQAEVSARAILRQLDASVEQFLADEVFILERLTLLTAMLRA